MSCKQIEKVHDHIDYIKESNTENYKRSNQNNLIKQHRKPQMTRYKI